MSPRRPGRGHPQCGISLIEVLVSVIIGMLLVLVIYQIYEVSEAQKRTITSGSDAQQNASYGLHVVARELAVAGNGIASAAATLDGCALLRPLPVLIEAGGGDDKPDAVTVFYGGSSTLSTPVPLKQAATTADPYVVHGPVGFTANDVVAAVQGANCTLSTVNAGGIAVDPATGFATLTHTPIAGRIGASYSAVDAALVNLGAAASMGRIAYTVDPALRTLRSQKLLPANDPVTPVVSDVVNLKAQYGLDTDDDGIVDTWQEATGNVWSAATLPTQPLATLRQIRAVRVAIVTRSAQYEKDPVSYGSLTMFDGGVTVPLAGEAQHYRYKVLETIVPLRNALWNAT